MNKQLLLLFGGLLTITLVGASCANLNLNNNTNTSNVNVNSQSAVNFRTNMTKLWSDHVIWTRAFIIGTVDNRPDAPMAKERLLKNQEDLGNAFKAYYGEDAGNQLTNLLRQHINIAADAITAAKARNQPKFSEANNRWRQNSNEIVNFLNQANPNWSKEDLSNMMNEHLSTTTAEAQARIDKDYAGDVRAFDTVYSHIITMANTLTDGVIKQFPEKFQ